VVSDYHQEEEGLLHPEHMQKSFLKIHVVNREEIMFCLPPSLYLSLFTLLTPLRDSEKSSYDTCR